MTLVPCVSLVNWCPVTLVTSLVIGQEKEKGCCYLKSLAVGFVHVSCKVCSRGDTGHGEPHPLQLAFW